MRYINKQDERLMVQEKSCTCGHLQEEHDEQTGACRAAEEVSGKACECKSYQPEEAAPDPVL